MAKDNLENDKFFDNKVCNICGAKAIIFRLIKNRHFLLCGHPACDKEADRRAG